VTIIDPKNKNDFRYLSGELVKKTLAKEFFQVKFDDGSKFVGESDETNVFPVSQISLRSDKRLPVEDLLLLKHVNEPEINSSLQLRYESDDVYTYCGNTLVSINPYCLFEGEYSLKKKLEYKQHLKNSFFIMQKIPPHVYSMALSSVHEIIYDDTPASKLSICMSGESGSGKTEASLYCLDFIVFCYNEKPDLGSIESRVRSPHQIINGHGVLAAFGNAKTMHNDNSSRFSKYINLFIDGDAQTIKGYETKTYMLEKGRLCNSGPDERKFHFFYALDKALTAEQRQKYRFKQNFAQYEYLAETMAVPCTNDDLRCFEEVMRVFKVPVAHQLFGVTEAETDALLTILSIILLFGNISFVQQADKSTPRSPGSVPKLQDSPDLSDLCELLGTQKVELELEFCRRAIGKLSEGSFRDLNTADCAIRK